jgi:hypothetical protein
LGEGGHEVDASEQINGWLTDKTLVKTDSFIVWVESGETQHGPCGYAVLLLSGKPDQLFWFWCELADGR